MNTDSVPVRRSRWLRLLLWFAVAVGASVAVLACVAVNAVTLSGDARAMRDALTAATGDRPATRVQITAGPGTLAAVRTVLHFVDPVPDEARMALRAVQSASVGIYELRGDSARSMRRQGFAAGDRVMTGRGWTRVVGVRDHGDLVMIYVPEGERRGGAQRVCVAVCHDRELVIVAGVAELDALLTLMERKSGSLTF